MNLFVTLLENVNKSRTSANNVSLSYGIIFFSVLKSLQATILATDGALLHLNFLFKVQ
jgi:hypothetical protein